MQNEGQGKREQPAVRLPYEYSRKKKKGYIFITPVANPKSERRRDMIQVVTYSFITSNNDINKVKLFIALKRGPIG